MRTLHLYWILTGPSFAVYLAQGEEKGFRSLPLLRPHFNCFFYRLLEVTIDNLEQTRSLVVEGTADGGPMTARFADLCEELARAVTSLLALQVLGLIKS